MKGTLDSGYYFLHNDSVIACVKWCDLAGVDNKSISSSVKKFSSLTREKMEDISGTVSLRYLLGVMLSEYAANLLRDQRAGDYHIYPEHLRNIPIPEATTEEQEEIICLVDAALQEKTDSILKDIDLKVRALYEKALKG